MCLCMLPCSLIALDGSWSVVQIVYVVLICVKAAGQLGHIPFWLIYGYLWSYPNYIIIILGRPSLLGCRPLLLGWRPSLLGWRPSLLYCPNCLHFSFISSPILPERLQRYYHLTLPWSSARDPQKRPPPSGSTLLKTWTRRV